MKNLMLLFTTILVGTFGINASDTATLKAGHHNFNPAFGQGNSFIFVENNITFSVFPNGEFDFYVNNTPYAGAHVNVSFNAGYDYNNYLQYDDYGAVIQVVNTPVFYDYYGRVAQIGSVRIHYNNRRVVRIGGLRIFYNPHGVYSHCNGYVNVYNRVYVYRPFHRYFVRPVTQFCMVSYQPYRQYYMPVRYSYYKPYVNNVRKCYASVGTTYYYKQNNARRAVYKNDKRVSRRSYAAYASGKTSRRAAANDYQKTPGKKYSNIQGHVSGRSYAKAYKKSNRSTTPVKKYKAPAGKRSYQKNVVRNSKPKKVSRKVQQRSSKSARSVKVVKKSSHHKRTTSKTKGRSKRSGT